MPTTRDSNAQAFYDLVPDLLGLIDGSGHVRGPNRAWTRVLGLDTAEGRSLAELAHAEDREALEQALARARAGSASAGVELRMHTADASIRLVTWGFSPDKDGVLAVGQDITEVREGEQELRETTRLMAQANAELTRFASVVAHDLQAPVRKMMMFAERLEAMGGDHLPAPIADMIRRMRASAERMSLLVTDLHAWSKATTTPLEVSRVELSRVVRDVLTDLDVVIERSGATVHVEPLPALEASPTLLRQLVQNLVANAVKFQVPGTSPVVRIGAREAADQITLVVSDNGIGIDPQYHERIFGMFQRLHTFEKYPGSGVGLATCAKVAERHNGSIRVESTVGHGATFLVTLPRVQPLP